MLCILPEYLQADVSLHMHFILLEAFCTENGIRVIKVDSASKLRCAMLEQTDGRADNKVERDLGDLDYGCILVEVCIW